MRAYRTVIGLAALALVLTVDRPAAHGDPAPLTLPGELREGDDRCTNLCDRYGFVWPEGTEVEIRLETAGFSAYLNVDGPGVHEVSEDPGRESSVVFVVPRAAPFTVIVNAYNYYDAGAYRLVVNPQPTQYLVPAVRQAPAQLTAGEQGADDPVLRAVDALVVGYRASGREVRAELDRIPALRFPARRGRCYRAVLVLDPAARWQRLAPSTPATAVAHMRLQTSRETRGTMQTSRSTARVVALDDDLCPSANGTLEITLEDQARGTVVSRAGTGGFVARVYERTVR
jgi:hypothetical protein